MRAANASGGADWAPARTFRIEPEPPDHPPHISFDRANDISITERGQRVEHRDRDWAFSGTASDPEGHLDHVDFHCWGNNCNETRRASGTTNWSYTRNGLEGHNRIHFYAYDSPRDQRNPDDDKHYIDLYVDCEAPESRHSLGGGEGQQGWYVSPVQVSLFAEDQGTGRSGTTHGIPNHFASGVQEIKYRVDGESWHTYSGPFTVSGDGSHTVDYYAVDRVGNTESSHSVSFKIDATPPSPPSGAIETHGVTSGHWQNITNEPCFTWSPSTDAGSGLWGYQVYFGEDPGGTGLTSLQTESYCAAPVRTGTYYFRARARDRAGNWSDWTTLFTFKYDGTPPENPTASHNAGIPNDTWQRETRTADFSWDEPYDEGSGVQGYYLYWGPAEDGISDTFTTARQFISDTPICAEDEAATWYLRLRSVDKVGNLAEDWSTAFTLRYDGAPPTCTFTINHGYTHTTQTRVSLQISAEDEGSGVWEMRLAPQLEHWHPWEAFATERMWEIPAISRRYHEVHLQVRDVVSNVSEVYSQRVYLDVNLYSALLKKG